MQPSDLHRRFEEAFNAGDLAGILALYEADAVLQPQPGQPAAGLAAISQALSAFLALKGTLTMQTVQVLESGDLALVYGKWTLAGTGPDGGAVHMAGGNVEVMRRQADGGWKFAIDDPFGRV